jgi:hypothetical protein
MEGGEPGARPSTTVPLADGSTEALRLLLMNRVRAEAEKSLKPEIQVELGKLLKKFTDLEPDNNLSVVGSVPLVLRELEMAIFALLTEPPNIELAKKLSRNVRWRLNWFNVLLARLLFPGESPATWLVLGLMLVGVLGLPLILLMYRALLSITGIASLGLDANMLTLVAISGGLGGVVSVAGRLLKVTNKDQVTPNQMFWTGLFKPVIGSIFAVFVYMLLNSGLVPKVDSSSKPVFAFAAIGFVAGFSERFAPDLATMAGKRAAG